LGFAPALGLVSAGDDWVTVLAPAPPSSVSAPALPVIVSLPSPPVMMSSPPTPVMVSLPSPPVMMSSPPTPVMVSLPSPPLIVSAKSVPVMVSFPRPPLIVLPGLAPLQSIVSLPSVPVTLVAVCVTPALTTQSTPPGEGAPSQPASVSPSGAGPWHGTYS
jgi:hypothetical protein